MSNCKYVSMKKILFLSIFISLGILRGLGQSEKNDLKITMAVLPLFGSSDEFDSTINGVAIKPSIGYFITTNTSIDLNFSYAAQNTLTIANIDSHYYSFAFTPTLISGNTPTFITRVIGFSFSFTFSFSYFGLFFITSFDSTSDMSA